jgi:hypothetical protein
MLVRQNNPVIVLMDFCSGRKRVRLKVGVEMPLSATHDLNPQSRDDSSGLHDTHIPNGKQHQIMAELRASKLDFESHILIVRHTSAL